jgi:hypothetical protein
VIAGCVGRCGTVMFRQLYPSSTHGYMLLEIPGDEEPHAGFEDGASCAFTWNVMLQPRGCARLFNVSLTVHHTILE